MIFSWKRGGGKKPIAHIVPLQHVSAFFEYSFRNTRQKISKTCFSAKSISNCFINVFNLNTPPRTRIPTSTRESLHLNARNGGELVDLVGDEVFVAIWAGRLLALRVLRQFGVTGAWNEQKKRRTPMHRRPPLVRHKAARPADTRPAGAPAFKPRRCRIRAAGRRSLKSGGPGGRRGSISSRSSGRPDPSGSGPCPPRCPGPGLSTSPAP